MKYFLKIFITLVLIPITIGFCSSAPKIQSSEYDSSSYDKFAEAEESAPKSYKKRSSAGAAAIPTSQADETAPITEKKERLVIYYANYSITVESVKSSIDTIKSITKKYNGFSENIRTSNSYKTAELTIRVPVNSFEKTIDEIEKIGNVTYKTISADDVTDKFTDMNLRINSLKKTRERLYQLLKRTKKPKERIKVLKEISRITEQIESLTASIEYLKDRADYSTIKISLRSFRKETTVKYIPSPFPWIRNLSYNKKSTEYSSWHFDIKKPTGYFEMTDEYKHEKKDYMFYTPGSTSAIRIGSVENYPEANREFWNQALIKDAGNRLYKTIKSETLSYGNQFSYLVFKINMGYIYSIAFCVADDKIIIAEAYYKDTATFNNKEEIFKEFIKQAEF